MNTTAQSETLQPADTVGALVEWGTATLAAAGIPTARLDTEVLLAHACGIDRAGLYARWRSLVRADCRSHFGALIVRRQRREPLQYIIGRQEFWSLDFVVTPDVLIPRPETELLVELALAIFSKSAFGFLLSVDEPIGCGCTGSTPVGSPRYQGGVRGGFGAAREQPPPSPLLSKEGVEWPNTRAPKCWSGSQGEGQGEGPLRLCDLGTGSGCMAVALARELQHAQIWALDLSESTLDLAQFNARRHGVADRIHFIASDGLSAAKGLRFDAIVCNPPYVSSRELQRAQPELAWEPRHALDGGPSGLAVIERMVAEAAGYLRETGWLLMEIGANHGPAVERLARSAGFGSVSIRADYAGLPRALVAQR